MRILGIESSCDETAAAVVSDGVRVESSVIASTKEVFSKSGGVVPEDAARRQVESILPVLHAALDNAQATSDTIDCIAVTKGPGLLGSLLTGTVAARALASLWGKPLIGVHHTFGHLSSVWPDTEQTPEFPCITLSASGGHTDLWYRSSHLHGKLLGRTRDDAAGEAFDKGAAMLGLPYPGGPSVSRVAANGNANAYDFPLALKNDDTLDFSFSGVKTALKNTVNAIGTLNEEVTADLAASYQEALCLQLVDRVTKALALQKDVREVHVVGGVSANSRLRTLLAENCSCTVRTPTSLAYCTDNAAMIASGAYFMHEELGQSAYDGFTTSTTLPLEEMLSA